MCTGLLFKEAFVFSAKRLRFKEESCFEEGVYFLKALDLAKRS